MKKLWQKVSPNARLFGGLAGIVLILDQWSKWWAVSRLTYAFAGATSFAEKVDRFLWLRHPVMNGGVTVIENGWEFLYVENPGAAWSIFATNTSSLRTPFFLIMALAAMAFIIVYFRRTQANQRILRVALSLVMGGALGNFSDRVRLGYVIDFIRWHYGDKFVWPTFNVADSAISIGVGLMILDMLLAPKEQTQAAAKRS